MANIKVLGEHSVDVDLLTGGICIDVGCRGFAFSEAMRDLGCKVLALDIEDMEVPEGIVFLKRAVLDKTTDVFYTDTKDQQAKHISDSGIQVKSVRLNYLYEQASNQVIDIVKIDAEGSEYAILSDPNFQPIPRQISVEFHMHCHRSLHDQYYDKCMENLLKYYEPVKHELTQAHGAGENYWDSLFLRKALL